MSGSIFGIAVTGLNSAKAALEVTSHNIGNVNTQGYTRQTTTQKASDPLFEYTLVLGDNRPYLTLLIAPSLPHLEDIAHQLQVTWSKREELLNNQQVLDEIWRRIHALTDKLPKHEQVKDLRLLIEGFTQENGLLTPSLKVKRREVEQRFSSLVEDMYNRAGKLLKR